MQIIDFELRGEFIPLDALLKATGLAPSGGFAKGMVADGKVQVNGQMELRKTCKIRAGQVVSVAAVRVHVQAASGIENPPSPSL
jgi:ribosome-associated protein